MAPACGPRSASAARQHRAIRVTDVRFASGQRQRWHPAMHDAQTRITSAFRDFAVRVCLCLYYT